MCVEKLSRFGVTVFAADGNAVLFICHIQSIKAADWRRRCVFACFLFFLRCCFLWLLFSPLSLLRRPETSLTFGNLSGSPGCLGMTFCSLWKP